MAVFESVVSQLGIVAKANYERLDAKLREEFNAVTSVLGDKFRAEKLKTQKAFTIPRALLLAQPRRRAAWQFHRISRQGS